jgi:hypothetical protein
MGKMINKIKKDLGITNSFLRLTIKHLLATIIIIAGCFWSCYVFISIDKFFTHSNSSVSLIDVFSLFLWTNIGFVFPSTILILFFCSFELYWHGCKFIIKYVFNFYYLKFVIFSNTFVVSLSFLVYLFDKYKIIDVLGPLVFILPAFICFIANYLLNVYKECYLEEK